MLSKVNTETTTSCMGCIFYITKTKQAGSIDQLHSTFTSVLKIYYYKNVTLWGEKRSLTSSQSCLLCVVCMHFGSLEVQMSEVSKIRKCRGFLAFTIYKPEFKQPDVKHDQGFCAYELIHPKHVVLTQLSMVFAVHV